MIALLVVHLASASPLPSVKGLLPGARPAGTVTLDVTGDDASLDPHDRAHVTLTHDGKPLETLIPVGARVRVSLDLDGTSRWAYAVEATAPMVAADALTLPLVPEADEPYPGEEPRDGVRTVVDHLFDVGDPGQALDVSVGVWDTRTRQWVTLGRAPVTWNLDRVAIGALQDEQEARFRVGLAAENTWPAAVSQDAGARRLVAGLVQKAVPPGAEVLGWNLGAAGWVLVRNAYGVVTQDRWAVNVGYRYQGGCWLGEVSLVREYVGTSPGPARLTGTSPTTARPILCEAIGR